MKLIMRTDDYTIYQRRDSRYAVQGTNKTPINGDEKVAILLKHELVKAPEIKQPEPEPEAAAEEAPAAEETLADDASAETETETETETTAEAPAEDPPADDEAS